MAKSRIGQLGKKERWAGIVRPYSDEDVQALRGSIRIEHSVARLGAERLWDLLNSQEYVGALGALTGTRRCSR